MQKIDVLEIIIILLITIVFSIYTYSSQPHNILPKEPPNLEGLQD